MQVNASPGRIITVICSAEVLSMTAFSGFAALLSDVLHDEPIVSVLIDAITVIHECETQVFPLLALIEC